MTSGLATSGRGAQVDQSFQRKHDRIDYKAQRQSLHRDDLNDLMSLTIGRMDMYNLVGALLLTFALQWITSSDIIAAPDVKYWPAWYSTVFVICCFSSVGYLLFSLWFAMQCSVTCQSLGTRLRINFARLSLPSNEDISRLKVPFFIPGGALEKMQNRIFEADGEADNGNATHKAQEFLQELRKEEQEADSTSSPASKLEPAARSVTFNHWRTDHGDKDDSDQDFEKHLRRWLYERGQWLSADAYARACMVVGMNQMLQALTYHVVATVWKVSALTSIACLLLAKALSLFMLQVDIGVRRYSCLGLSMVMLLEVLPPTYATMYLFIYVPGIQWPGWLQGVACLPVFFMHGIWMCYLSYQLSPTSGNRGQAVDVEDFLSDSDDTSSGSEVVDEDIVRQRFQMRRGFYGTEFLPHRLKANKLFNIIELEGHIPEDELRDAKAPAVDPMPGRVSVNFTWFLAVLWILSGIIHATGQIYGFDQAAIIDCSDDNCTTSGQSVPIWPHARPRPQAPARHHPLRRLRGSGPSPSSQIQCDWPAPASLFEVKALHCGRNSSHIFVHNGFATFESEIVSRRLGELRRQDWTI
ncbi:unnamed protein product [Symbiodinium natans]|uniref:Uncharacterized protein n=1 Tax=Symbiodinium natans TaxID=878477 RepID=A0A812MA01_9DINO|nr:unnamed protein product [Symbiodinium natans]